MKIEYHIAIIAGVSVAVVIGVLVGQAAYQQAELESEYEEIVIDLETVYFDDLEEMSKDMASAKSNSTEPEPPIDVLQYCSGKAACFVGNVTRVIDGDTILVDDNSIQFTLASTPELSQFGGVEAKQFVEQICPVGSEVIVDEDDFQTEGSYGRMIAVIYCNGVNVNEAVLDAGHAWLASDSCDTSEFSSEDWAKKYGC